MKEDYCKKLSSDFNIDLQLATDFYFSASLENGNVFRKYFSSSDEIEKHTYKLAYYRLEKFLQKK